MHGFRDCSREICETSSHFCKTSLHSFQNGSIRRLDSLNCFQRLPCIVDDWNDELTMGSIATIDCGSDCQHDNDADQEKNPDEHPRIVSSLVAEAFRFTLHVLLDV